MICLFSGKLPILQHNIQCLIEDNVLPEANYKRYRLQPIINTTFMVKKA